VILRLFLFSSLNTNERAGQGRFLALDLRKNWSSFIIESRERSSDMFKSGQINILLKSGDASILRFQKN
jgi:hypothetical protein